MFAFYDQDTNELLGHAQSYLPCHQRDLGEEHAPHIHALPKTMGPFFCAGLPEVSTYTIEDRN
jgi:hypothetical protein